MIEFMDKNKIKGLTQRESERQALVWSLILTASASTSTWQLSTKCFYTFNALNFVIALALPLYRLSGTWFFFAISVFNAFSM